MDNKKFFCKCYRCGELIEMGHLTSLTVCFGPAYDICDQCLDKFLDFIEGKELTETLETEDLEW